MRSERLTGALMLAAIGTTLMLTVAIAVGTYLGYRWFTETRLVSADEDGTVRAKVIRAALFGREDLRVGQLSGVVQGVGRASRVWGWLNSSQVIKAPFKVDYFVPLERLSLADFHYDRDRQVLFIAAPEPIVEPATIDLASTSLNDVGGVFVTRGAMVEMARKVAASAQIEAAARAARPENRAKVREYARSALTRLFGGALRATGLTARVEVRFPGDPVPSDGRRWDLSRSLEEVLGDRR